MNSKLAIIALAVAATLGTQFALKKFAPAIAAKIGL